MVIASRTCVAIIERMTGGIGAIGTVFSRVDLAVAAGAASRAAAAAAVDAGLAVVLRTIVVADDGTSRTAAAAAVDAGLAVVLRTIVVAAGAVGTERNAIRFPELAHAIVVATAV